MSKEFNNKIMTDNQIEINGNSNSLVNKQNTNNQIDNSTINQIYKIPKRMTEEEKEKLRKETLRPAFKEKEGEIMTCFGYVVREYSTGKYTILNIIDRNGNFVADHIQLDFKTYEYDYSNIIGSYIRFTGKVYKYSRGDCSFDFSVDIIDKVMILPDKYYIVSEDFYDPEENEIDYDYISNYLSNSNITNIYNLINRLREEINFLTEGIYCRDYLYYYTINQYFLNQATYNIYEGDLRDQNFNEDGVIGLLMILGSLVYDLRTQLKITLHDILSNISYDCNSIQGVISYDKVTDNPKLASFILNNITKGNKIGKKKFKTLWDFIVNRKRNFNHTSAINHESSEDKLTIKTYCIIDKYIPKK